MKAGFTGTRKGMTDAQKSALEEILALHFPFYEFSPNEFHHGDCIGADAEAHDIAHLLGWRIVIHPPIANKLRAWKTCDTYRIAMPYLDRNRIIVDETDILIACPSGTEVRRSGTWSTIRYSKKAMVIYPNGEIDVQNKDD